jgi:hypothetical protein
MAQSIQQGDLFVNGALTCKQFTPPAGSVGDAGIQAAAGIQATKLIHQFPVSKRQAGAAATATEIVHCHYAAATVVAVQVACGTHPTSSDTVSVDVQRGNSGAGFSSILSAPVVLNSSTANLTPTSGSIASPNSAAGDCLEVVITVTGTSCHDLLVEIWLRENPQ